MDSTDIAVGDDRVTFARVEAGIAITIYERYGHISGQNLSITVQEDQLVAALDQLGVRPPSNATE